MNQKLDLTASEFAALKRGDVVLFQRVFDQNYSLIKYVVCQCGVTDEDANDVTQEIFLRFHTHLSKINRPESIKSWLITSARNLAIDHIRKSKKLTTLDDDAYEATHIEDNDGLLHELELKLVGKLIDQLAVKSGDTTLVEFYRQGLSAKEISEKNNEPISTVTNRLSRLRKKFSGYLRQHIEELRESVP